MGPRALTSFPLHLDRDAPPSPLFVVPGEEEEEEEEAHLLS